MADLDILTLDEAKAALSTDSTTDDTEIVTYVSAVSLLIDDLCGPVVERDVTEQFDGGTEILILSTLPVASVTTVTEYASTTPTVLTAEAWPTSSADDYYLNSGAGIVARRTNGLAARFASTRVVVSYVAGRFVDTASVDDKFKLAAKITLAELWRAEKGAGNVSYGAVDFDPRPDGFAIPRRAKQLLAGEFRGPVLA